MWFHSAVLDIFRPFVSGPLRTAAGLRTFKSPDSSVKAIFEASVRQLKRIIITYRSSYQSSSFTMLWHTALVYVANTVLLTSDHNEDDMFYFLLCLYGYEGLRRSWRMTEAIVEGLLSMKLRDGGISSILARRLVNDVRIRGFADVPAEVRATFMVDLDLAMSNPSVATAEVLASEFEHNIMLKDLTTVLDDSETEMTPTQHAR